MERADVCVEEIQDSLVPILTAPIRARLIDDEAQLSRIVMRIYGTGFSQSREKTAIHEAGHCVLSAYEGEQSKFAVVFKEDCRGLLGLAVRRGRLETLYSMHDHLRYARITIAGVAAELLFAAEGYSGTSLGEVCDFRGRCWHAAQESGDDFQYLIVEEFREACRILLLHEMSARAIAAELLSAGSLRGRRLAELLATVSQREISL